MKHAGFGWLVVALLATPVARGSDNDASGLTTQATQTTYFFCRSGYEASNGQFLFSRTQSVPAGVRVPDLERSFRAFVAKNYGYPNDKSLSCPFRSGDTREVAEQGRQQTIGNLRAANLGVAETDWVYTPVAGGPTGPAPAAKLPPLDR